MSIPPEKASEVREWLHKSVEDIRAAELDLGAFPPLVEDSLFHCQQAVEKALKGFLAFHDIQFRKTHDIDELSSKCEELKPGLKSVLGPARDLSVFAGGFRYPGGAEPPPVDEAKKMLEVARSACEAVRSSFPSGILQDKP